MHTRPLLLLCLILPAAAARAQTTDPQLPSVTVTAPRPSEAASELRVPGATLNNLPIIRPGEVLEAVPGLIVTQHSGEGKANQYFLRGFNLDHGTDFAITVDGMPVNMPTHGHGQGYADLNFLIPELVDAVCYRKGPYYADEGDFSSAGAVHVDYSRPPGQELRRRRPAAATAIARGLAGRLDDAGPAARCSAPARSCATTAPGTFPTTLRKLNGVLRYSRGHAGNGFAVTGMAYTNSWNSTDQIPQRAVDAGPDRPLRQHRSDRRRRHPALQLSARWSRSGEKSAHPRRGLRHLRTLNLFNNFTYFLDNPVNGDQFQQSDKRFIRLQREPHVSSTCFAGFDAETTVGAAGAQRRSSTSACSTPCRARRSRPSAGPVSETSVGLYVQTAITLERLAAHHRSACAATCYLASVDSNTRRPTPATTARLPAQPQARPGVRALRQTRSSIVNAGYGFHSNDARGATITVDPVTGTPQPRCRCWCAPRARRSASAPRPSRDWNRRWRSSSSTSIRSSSSSATPAPPRPAGPAGASASNGPTTTSRAPWLLFDVDVACTQARFTTSRPGRRLHSRRAVRHRQRRAGARRGRRGWFGGLRLRYFGPRPLIEDGSVYSSSPRRSSARRLGYMFDNGVRLQLDVFNLLNTQASQIDYYYASRLPGEPRPASTTCTSTRSSLSLSA